MRNAHVVGVAEIVLQPLKFFCIGLQSSLGEEVAEHFDRIAELFRSDPELVPLARIETAETLAALSYLAAPPVEKRPHDNAEFRGGRKGFLAAHLEPPQQTQHRCGIA